MNLEKRVTNLYGALTSAKLDQKVGIKVTHLTGTDNYSFFVAEIAPHKKIPAHYHKSGVEIYQIVEGNGVMYTGNRNSDERISWNPPLQLQQGDCFTVNEGEVHQFFNDSGNKIIVIFGCSKSHLSKDRFFVEGFYN